MFIHHSLNNYMGAIMEQLLTSQGREGCMVCPNTDDNSTIYWLVFVIRKKCTIIYYNQAGGSIIYVGITQCSFVFLFITTWDHSKCLANKRVEKSYGATIKTTRQRSKLIKFAQQLKKFMLRMQGSIKVILLSSYFGQ